MPLTSCNHFCFTTTDHSGISSYQLFLKSSTHWFCCNQMPFLLEPRSWEDRSWGYQLTLWSKMSLLILQAAPSSYRWAYSLLIHTLQRCLGHIGFSVSMFHALNYNLIGLLGTALMETVVGGDTVICIGLSRNHWIILHEPVLHNV